MTTHTQANAPAVGYVALVRGNPNFRNLWLGQIVSLLGDWFNLIASAALVGMLTQSGLGIGAMERTPLPAQTQLGDTALLIGYETSPARGERALDVTLYWFALRETGANLNVFVHLLGADGGVMAQHDGAPVGGFTPTSRWRAGEVIADTHRILLPPEVGPGEYGLKAGMYDPATVTNLPVDPPTPDNRVELGAVRITLD